MHHPAHLDVHTVTSERMSFSGVREVRKEKSVADFSHLRIIDCIHYFPKANTSRLNKNGEAVGMNATCSLMQLAPLSP